MKLYHIIRLSKGTAIYVPSSIPEKIQRFVDGVPLESNRDMDKFKEEVVKVVQK